MSWISIYNLSVFFVFLAIVITILIIINASISKTTEEAIAESFSFDRAKRGCGLCDWLSESFAQLTSEDFPHSATSAFENFQTGNTVAAFEQFTTWGNTLLDKASGNDRDPNLQEECQNGFCAKILEKDKFRKEDSAALLHEVHDFYTEIVKVLPPDDRRTKILLKRFAFDKTIFEVDPVNRINATSYNVNKGEQMGLCLRQTNGEPVSVNTIKFVFAHEISHTFTVTKDHTKEFWSNFKWLLQILNQHKLLEMVDYSKYPVMYCGLEVTNNPFFDNTIIVTN